jgi:hypothetical protein
MPGTALVPRELLVQLGHPSAIRLGSAVEASTSVARARLELDTLDLVLGGGLPRGRLSEIVGPTSCGKTALLYALLATDTARGEVVALVDLADAFLPSTAAAAGIDLTRTLWVRPTSIRDALRSAELLLDGRGFGAIAVDLGTTHTGHSACVATRATRIGTSTWARLARAAAQSGAAVVLLGNERVAGTFAALGLTLRTRQQHWSRRDNESTLGSALGPTLFDGFDTEVALVRNKLGAPHHGTMIRVMG